MALKKLNEQQSEKKTIRWCGSVQETKKMTKENNKKRARKQK